MSTNEFQHDASITCVNLHGKNINLRNEIPIEEEVINLRNEIPIEEEVINLRNEIPIEEEVINLRNEIPIEEEVINLRNEIPIEEEVINLRNEIPIEEEVIKVDESMKESLLANHYAAVEFLKNELEEKNAVIRTLLSCKQRKIYRTVRRKYKPVQMFF